MSYNDKDNGNGNVNGTTTTQSRGVSRFASLLLIDHQRNNSQAKQTWLQS